MITKACLQRLVEQRRQRHGERADLVQGQPDRRWRAGGIDKTQRNRAAIGGNLAGREGLGVDLHGHAPDNHALYFYEYIVLLRGGQPGLGAIDEPAGRSPRAKVVIYVYI